MEGYHLVLGKIGSRRMLIRRFVFALGLFGFVILDSVLSSLSVADEVSSEDRIIQLEKNVIESRRAIGSGKVVFSSRFTTFSRNPRMENIVKRRTVYFNGEHIRCDSFAGASESQYVFTPDTLIRNIQPDKNVQVMSPPPVVERPLQTPNPLLLGIGVWYTDSLNGRGFEEVFLNPNRDRFRLERGSREGKRIWRISTRLLGTHPQIAEYILSEREGGLPIYIAIHDADEPDKYMRSVATTLKQHGTIWFPQEVVFQIQKGGKVVTEEVVTVEDAVFDAVPTNAFTLGGLDLPKGRLVTVGSKVQIWDGQRLVDPADLYDHQTQVQSPTPMRRIALVASFALAGAACLILMWRLKRGKTPSSGDI